MNYFLMRNALARRVILSDMFWISFSFDFGDTIKDKDYL